MCVFNSCTVKTPSESSFINLINSALAKKKIPIATGCVPQSEKDHPSLSKVSCLGIYNTERIVEVVEESLKGNIIKILDSKALHSLSLPKVRRNQLTEIIPISNGCLGRCTYCKTKFARGRLVSYPIEEIIARVNQVIG